VTPILDSRFWILDRRAVAVVAIAFCAASAHAEDARALIDQGNTHFEAGRYEDALKSYEQAGEPDDPLVRPELLHNKAAALFKLGRIDDARELWVRSASLRDERFEAAARYNLGNCAYADALHAVEQQDASAALEKLDQARGYYRDALRLGPDLTNARANLELATQLKRQLEQQATSQPQSQPASRPEQQQQDQQQPSSQPSTQPDDQQQQQGQGQNEQQQQEGDQHDQERQQQESSEPQPESQPSTQPSPQPQASEVQQDQQQPQMLPLKMTKQEAERLLQLIRDAEAKRRALLQAREARKHKPVDKDW